MRLSVRTVVSMRNFSINPKSDPQILLINKDIPVKGARAYVLTNVRPQLLTDALS